MDKNLDNGRNGKKPSETIFDQVLHRIEVKRSEGTVLLSLENRLRSGMIIGPYGSIRPDDSRRRIEYHLSAVMDDIAIFKGPISYISITGISGFRPQKMAKTQCDSLNGVLGLFLELNSLGKRVLFSDSTYLRSATKLFGVDGQWYSELHIRNAELCLNNEEEFRSASRDELGRLTEHYAHLQKRGVIPSDPFARYLLSINPKA